MAEQLSQAGSLAGAESVLCTLAPYLPSWLVAHVSECVDWKLSFTKG